MLVLQPLAEGAPRHHLRRWRHELADPWSAGAANAAQIFRAVARRGIDLAPTTRSDLADELRTSPTTVGKVVAELVARGLLSEGDPESQGRGRPKVPLLVSAERWLIIGIKIADAIQRPDELIGVVVNLRGELVFRAPTVRIATHEDRAVFRRSLVERIALLCRELSARIDQLDHALLGIGVELGGHIDEGHVVFSVNNGIGGDSYFDEDSDETINADLDERETHRRPTIAGGMPLQDDLEWATREAVIVSNDVSALAIMDSLYGATRAQSTLTVSVLRDGIGGALVVGGRLLAGATGAAMEIGHIKVEPAEGDEQQAKCRCGRRRHLECYATPKAILDQIESATSWETALEVDGDQSDAFRRAGRALGLAIASTLTLVNPAEVVVYVPEGLGPERRSHAAQAYQLELGRHYRAEAFSNTWQAPLRCIELPDADAPIRGAIAAAVAVLESLLTDMEIAGH